MKIGKLNSIVIALFFKLLVACSIGLVERTNAALESSSKDLKNKILKIKKESHGKRCTF